MVAIPVRRRRHPPAPRAGAGGPFRRGAGVVPAASRTSPAGRRRRRPAAGRHRRHPPGRVPRRRVAGGRGARGQFRARGDADGRMRALNLLGVIRFERGRLGEAEQSLAEALDLATQLGRQPHRGAGLQQPRVRHPSARPARRGGRALSRRAPGLPAARRPARHGGGLPQPRAHLPPARRVARRGGRHRRGAAPRRESWASAACSRSPPPAGPS